MAEKVDVDKRAGTRLNHQFTERVYARNGKLMGHIDRRASVLQCGGQARNFIFHRKKAIGIAMDVWTKLLREGVEWIEYIDNEHNRCYRVSVAQARIAGEPYEAGNGPQWGVPLAHFTITDGEGRVILLAPEPVHDPPAPKEDGPKQLRFF